MATIQTGNAPLTIAGRTLESRLLLGTGGFPSLTLLAEAIRASGTELVTVALRRVDPTVRGSLIDVLEQEGVELLPNTAGCFTARDAVLTAKLAREAFQTDWVKLEVIGDEDTLLPDTIAELTRLGISPKEVALDGGFNVGPTCQTLDDHGLEPDRVYISGRQQPGSRRTQRRLQRYRTGAEGRISHLKRSYGMDRSRLKGDEGQQIWTGWAVLAYNADTLAVRKW